MNNELQKEPLIKSWFGFTFGAIATVLSISDLSHGVTLPRVLSLISFLCFWFLWSHTTHFNSSLKDFFKNNKHSMSKPHAYLAITATVLIIVSAILRLIKF